MTIPAAPGGGRCSRRARAVESLAGLVDGFGAQAAVRASRLSAGGGTQRRPASAFAAHDSGRPRTTRNDVVILNLGAISGPFPQYARSAIFQKARICRPFVMPEEGLEPPTRGL